MKISKYDITQASEKYEINANMLKHWYRLMGTEHLQTIYDVYVEHAKKWEPNYMKYALYMELYMGVEEKYMYRKSMMQYVPKVYKNIINKYYSSPTYTRKKEPWMKTKKQAMVEEIDAKRETTPFHKEVREAYRKLKAGKISLENYLINI